MEGAKSRKPRRPLLYRIKMIAADTRKAYRKDLGAIHSLACQVAKESFPAANKKRMKKWEQEEKENLGALLDSRRDLFLVMQIKGKTVACGSGHIEKDRIVLGHAFCKEQGSGHGKRILGQLLAWAICLPGKTLVCDAPAGSSAESFLRKIGFEESSRSQDSTFGHQLVRLTASSQRAYDLFTQQR